VRPILFSIGQFDFVVSPIFAGLGALLAFYYCWRQRAHLQLSEDDFWQLMLWLSAGTFLGGILLYFFFFGGGVSGNINYMLKRHTFRGGAFYGNFWGAFLALVLFARVKSASLPRMADIVGTAAPLALSLSRIGCFLQGCCHGIPTLLPWGVEFTHPRSSVRKFLLGIPLHPTQIYEMVAAFSVFCTVHFLVLPRIRSKKLPVGSAFCVSAGAYALLRFGIEFLRGRDRGVFRPLGLSSNQVFALLSLAAAVWLYQQWQRKKASA
jgi:phosphatidylglycerol:prolipoprotein diacylglycerol transferase